MEVLCGPLIDAAEEFRGRLVAAREAVGPVWFAWYPYDSLGNAVHLTRLLEGTAFDLMSAVQGKTVLDLGCADGDFAFFLESLGASVVAVDHPRGNHNNLAGITTLREHLESSVRIVRMDLDAGLSLGPERFELAIALGLLYHLKNPIQFLETLSKSARYCILSTRVMRRLPGRSFDVAPLPVAYLLGPDELNCDNSNFWIFTPSGLKRLLERSHWKLLASISVGDIEGSRPDTLNKDERAFCLLESTWGDIGIEMQTGFHEPEDTGWRWVAQRFTVLATDARDAGLLSASLYVPDALIAAFGPVTLEVSVNGTPLDPECFETPGLWRYLRHLPSPSSSLRFEFSVSHAFAPDDSDPRERSLIVESIALDA